MNRKFLPITIMLAAVLMLTQAASAHPGHNHGSGFSAGAAHPFSGINHILAMLAVGLLAAQAGGRALWVMPTTFVALMVGGGMLNLAGVQVPFVEQGIIASVFVLGVVIALAQRQPLAVSVALIGLFAIFHGFAHIAEINTGVSTLGYALGFVIATATLHLIGIVCGLAIGRLSSVKVIRLGGAAIAMCGLLLCFHVM